MLRAGGQSLMKISTCGIQNWVRLNHVSKLTPCIMHTQRSDGSLRIGLVPCSLFRRPKKEDESVCEITVTELSTVCICKLTSFSVVQYKMMFHKFFIVH